MFDPSVLIMLLAFTNQQGFNNIKNAIYTADNFTNKINSLTTVFNMLPQINGMMNSNSSTPEREYVDTLKDVLSSLNAKK